MSDMDFYRNIPYEEAELIDRLVKLNLELRENRRRLLAQYGVEEESQLKDAIVRGAVDEHPAYEFYLSACVLKAEMQSIREQLKEYLKDL